MLPVPEAEERVSEERPDLARALNSFDATLIVMGGIIGTGIFVNPSVVAGRAQTTPLILTAWGAGGAIALFGGVTAVDFVFFVLAAVAVFVFRARDKNAQHERGEIRVPGHPYTTATFAIVGTAVAGYTIYAYPRDTIASIAILFSAVPVFYLWRRLKTERMEA